MPQNNQFYPRDKGGGWKRGDFFKNTTSHKGSILLYVLFLSSFLILFFVSFQWEIEKTLEWAKDSEMSVIEMSSVQDALVSLKNAPSAIKIIDANTHLSLVSLNQTSGIFSESLGGADPREYWITSTGAASITLTITSWWPFSYQLAAFTSGSEVSAVNISSGVVTMSATINLSPTLDQNVLVIDPLGWSAQYTLDAGSATMIPATSSYRLERDINGYKKDEWMYDVVNFIQKSRPNFDYQKMGMYLK